MKKRLLTVITGLFILAGTGLALSSGLTAKDIDPCCNAVQLTSAERAVLTGAVSDCEGPKTATTAKEGCGDKTATAAKEGCGAPASASADRSATASVGGAAVAEKECCDGTAVASADCCGTCTGEKSASAAVEAKAGCGDVSTAAVKSDCEAPASAGVSRSATAGEGVAGPVEKAAEKAKEKSAEKAGCDNE